MYLNVGGSAHTHTTSAATGPRQLPGRCQCGAGVAYNTELFGIVAALRVCEYALGAIDVANRLEHVSQRSAAFKEMAAPHMDTPDALEALPEIRILMTHTIGKLLELQEQQRLDGHR